MTQGHTCHTVFIRSELLSPAHAQGEVRPTSWREAYQRMCDSILRLSQGVERRVSLTLSWRDRPRDSSSYLCNQRGEASRFHMEKQKSTSTLPFRWEIDPNALFYSAHIFIGWELLFLPIETGEMLQYMMYFIFAHNCGNVTEVWAFQYPFQTTSLTLGLSGPPKLPGQVCPSLNSIVLLRIFQNSQLEWSGW